MKLSSICHLLTVLFLLAKTGCVAAHEVETCLMRVEQASGQLKTCKIAQTAKGQCELNQRKLDRFRQQCLEDHYPDAHIARAVISGSQQVQGDPHQSPYQRQMTRNRWEQTQMKPNLERFSHIFPEFGHFQSAMTEHFSTPKCPNAYQGEANRWLYVGSIQLTRYGLGDEEQKSPVNRIQHLFAPEVMQQCYPIPTADSGQSLSVINVPDRMINELAKEGASIRCAEQDCEAEKEAIARRFQQYQGAYRQYRQFMQCADIAQRNRTRGKVKGIRRSAVKLPDYCPKDEVEVAYLNASGLIEELDQRLFNPATDTSTTAKMTSD